MSALIRNKSFWTAVLAVVQTLVLHYLNIDVEVWATIDALLLVVISIFATEDIATRVVSGMKAMFVEFRKQDEAKKVK